jgi:hypothetical protein
MALTYDTRLGQKFAELVEKETQDLKNVIAAGTLKPREYKYAAGRIKGLDDALGLYNEAISIVNGAERS